MSGLRRFRAGLVQLRSGRSVTPNLDKAEGLIRRAAKGGAIYVQTPENTGLMELKPELVLEAAETEETQRAACAAPSARPRARHLSSHRLARHQARRDARRQPLLCDRPRGQGRRALRQAAYVRCRPSRRRELSRSPQYFRPGEKAVVADLPFGRLGLSICYDLRFPALYRALASAGAEFIAVPSAFTRQTGEAHWHVLIRARAIETGAFVLAATQGGLHENGRATYGHSLIVSPWGEVLAEGGEDPCVVFADIDLAASEEARARIPALKHGRGFEVEIAGADAEGAEQKVS